MRMHSLSAQALPLPFHARTIHAVELVRNYLPGHCRAGSPCGIQAVGWSAPRLAFALQMARMVRQPRQLGLLVQAGGSQRHRTAGAARGEPSRFVGRLRYLPSRHPR
jgi:hypothetical protein